MFLITKTNTNTNTNTKTKKIKNKKSKKNCKHFCKKDYMIEMNKVFKKNYEKNNIPYQPPTEKENKLMYKSCKKSFCNKSCDGFDFFGDVAQQKQFKKKIKNGFHDRYSNNEIQMLKKKGALSGCVDNQDYNVFHN